MGKSKKLSKKLNSLSKKLYDSKYVSREEFFVSQLSKSIKRYYNSLTPERKKSFISYLIKQEEWESKSSLEKYSTNDDDDNIQYQIKSCKTISQLNRELDNRKQKVKKSKKKRKNVIKDKSGLFHLLNPESYDQTLLDKKDYRKMLKNLAEKEKDYEGIVLDGTLENFHKELIKNKDVNEMVMSSFWSKIGFDE